MLKHWIRAARPRTLPLAISTVGMGAVLAAIAHKLNTEVLFWSVLTTILLQVLSNFANDLGDSINGADHASTGRTGPTRAVQVGSISAAAMKRAVYLTSLLAFISGLMLLWSSLGTNWNLWLPFLGLGVAAIAAAILYTMGKRPYGYLGLGDLFVFVFFGLVGVGGSYYLHAGQFSDQIWYGAFFVGAMSVQVLNANNLRDVDSDRIAGKLSIPVRIGRGLGLLYHVVLYGIAVYGIAVIVDNLRTTYWQSLAMLFPMVNLGGFILSVITRYRKGETAGIFDRLLPQTALTTIGCIIAIAVWLALH